MHKFLAAAFLLGAGAIGGPAFAQAYNSQADTAQSQQYLQNNAAGMRQDLNQLQNSLAAQQAQRDKLFAPQPGQLYGQPYTQTYPYTVNPQPVPPSK